MSNQPAPSQTDREPREIFLAAVHDRFDDGKMSWENAWNTCAKVTHTSVYDSWMAKLKNQPEDLKKKAADIANTLPSAGELDARNDRLRRVVERVNEVMTQHPRPH